MKIRALDRYVFTEFWKIFATASLGFPILVFVIDSTDNLDKYLSRHLGIGSIALSYMYWLPDSMFMALPAAVLFATVFAIGALTRHAEITAAKASGISFHRLIVPIAVGAAIASIAGLVIGELAPVANKKRLDIIEPDRASAMSERYNFAFAGEDGRAYKVGALRVADRNINSITIERRGSGPKYPSYVLSGSDALYNPVKRQWMIRRGALHVIPDSVHNITFAFDSVVDRKFSEEPRQLTLAAKAPTDMGFSELGRFIDSMDRSGADVNGLKVERMLKIVIPITCVIIFMFGAPLATSSQRGGTAYGIGLSLATTLIFLVMIQLTRGIGGHGQIPATLAAWLPSLLFGVTGAILLARVRT